MISSAFSPLSGIAVVYALDNKVVLAFNTLGSRDFPEFIQVMTTWSDAFEQIETGLTLSNLRDVMKIFAWQRPHWGDIANFITPPLS